MSAQASPSRYAPGRVNMKWHVDRQPERKQTVRYRTHPAIVPRSDGNPVEASDLRKWCLRFEPWSSFFPSIGNAQVLAYRSAVRPDKDRGCEDDRAIPLVPCATTSSL